MRQGAWFRSPFDAQIRSTRPHGLNAKLDVLIEVHA